MDAATALAPTVQTGSFTTARKHLERLLRLGPEFTLHGNAAPQRAILEDYVARQFAGAYGAALSEFLPDLISMRCNNRFSAVAGLRGAHAGRLFVEHYLDAPAQQALQPIAGRALPRRAIAEIGNLSATQRGATLLFFVVLAGILDAARFEWAIFAATEQVRRIIDHLGFDTYDLGPADATRLGPDAERWGRYYDTCPRVIVADVAATTARLRASALPAAALNYFAQSIAGIADPIRSRTFK